MKLWKTDMTYQSMSAMGDWHSSTIYVRADSNEEAVKKVEQSPSPLYGWNLSVVAKEITQEEWDAAEVSGTKGCIFRAIL